MIIPLILPFLSLTLAALAQTTTPEVLANLQWFAEYSAVAYCSDNYLVPFNGSVICPSSVCPLIPTVPSVQIADSFIKVNFYQTVRPLHPLIRSQGCVGLGALTSAIDWTDNGRSYE